MVARKLTQQSRTDSLLDVNLSIATTGISYCLAWKVTHNLKCLLWDVWTRNYYDRPSHHLSVVNCTYEHCLLSTSDSFAASIQVARCHF